jgi:hypothetical protein
MFRTSIIVVSAIVLFSADHTASAASKCTSISANARLELEVGVIQKPVIGNMEIMETVGLAAPTVVAHSTSAYPKN